MRILHTADWHLGRLFNGFSLLEDQAQLLEQIALMVKEEGPDLLIIAGDVFDRGNPRREAVELFDTFLERVYRDSEAAICVIAGNHDAPERIGFGGALHDRRRVLIRGGLSRPPQPLLLSDEEGGVAVSAIPYAGIFAARDHFDDPGIATPEDVVVAQMREANALLPAKVRQVVVSHTFVAGGRGSDSERSLESAGGIEQVSPECYGGAAYVAMGHLHRPQEIALREGTLRYAGSILPFGFDEAEEEKSTTLLELRWWGVEKLTELPLDPPRRLRVLTGSFDELMRGEQSAAGCFVKLELTDSLPVPDAMSRLRERYPLAVMLDWVNRRSPGESARVGARRESLRRPGEVIDSFFRDLGVEQLEQRQRELVDESLARAIATRERGEEER
ncbi:MAG: exonuclease SbcCD subunit D [Alkalispirochaetaceae bacterium]